MPKDSWAKDKARSIGRRAIRTGEYDRFDDDLKPNMVKPWKESEASAPMPIQCPKCKAWDPKRTPITFKDGTKHIKVNCGKCKRFIKWEGR